MKTRLKQSLGFLSNHTSQDRSIFYEQTHQFYDKCSSVYEVLYPDHLDFSKNILDKIVPVLRENNVKNVLDASCGIGYDLEVLSAYNEFNLWGIDSSEQMVSVAKDRFEGLGLNVEISNCDARNFKDYPSYDYDFILFRGNTLSNLDYDDYNKVMANFAKGLRPGGLLCVDFRDGLPHYSSNDRFEFRGFKFDKDNGKMFVSWYLYAVPENILDTFKVSAYVLGIDIRHIFPSFSLDRTDINSHYVLKDKLVEALHDNKLQIFWENKDDEGLPFLVTYLCQKKE